MRTSRLGRSAQVAKLGAKVGGTFVSTAARKVFASAERRIELDDRRRITNAKQALDELGQMKGAMMKLGQMASYLDSDLALPMRTALAQLRTNAPPMSQSLVANVIHQEFGKSPDDLFALWDPNPIAAASIGQVHRAVAVHPSTGEEIPVAVKVQYPGVAAAIESDLKNADMLGALLRHAFGGLDPDDLVAEVRQRLVEELDYEREAANQLEFAEFFRDHPYIHIPDVHPWLSTARVMTSDLVAGHTWDELLTWDQTERDLAGETLFRFVFRSLYTTHAFNGDPHPGNYLFHRGGRVTFLDFGLVKRFTTEEMAVFANMVKAAAVDDDRVEFRLAIEQAGVLRRDAPFTTDEIGDYFQQFYEPVRVDREMSWTSDYSNSIIRNTFDRSNPILQHTTLPSAFVFIQRINLGLYALLGELRASGNYRRISEELWPFVTANPSTPIGHAEARWLAEK